MKAPAPQGWKQGNEATADYTTELTPCGRKTLALWAADCAEHVLPHFEKLHPDDNRPRRAIDAARSWARGEITMMMARGAASEAHAAARDAVHPSAVASARTTGHASATAHSIRHARVAAAYAIVAALAAASPNPPEPVIASERGGSLPGSEPAHEPLIHGRTSPPKESG